MSRTAFMLALAAAIFPVIAHAVEPKGMHFTREDWEVACDNTRTCRAAGYQSEGDELPVSVLLTRKAGPRQPVTGQVMIGSYDEDDIGKKLPSAFKLSLHINGRSHGDVSMRTDTRTAPLSGSQVAALIAALRQNSRIVWSAGDFRWQLSDKGASAVLLKMDEIQGRVGTTGALHRKGQRDESSVLPPLPEPEVVSPPLAAARPDDAQAIARNAKTLRAALHATITDEYCPALAENSEEKSEEGGEAERVENAFVARLTDKKLLVSAKCWSGAYNFGYGYWVINDAPPYQHVLVTPSGSGFSNGEISAQHKGRGLGDCWSADAWTWNGKEFVHTASATTGMCKLVAAGGAWSLPTIVTKVRRPGR